MKQNNKKQKSEEKIDWFWSHQRNLTLLQSDLVAKHFRGTGYHPHLPFAFDNQLFIFRPSHGVYLFYDRKLMDKAMKELLQAVIKADKDIITHFHQRTEEIIGRLLMVGREIHQSNLSLFTNAELKKLFIKYKEAISAAPMITIQLWGIESCWLNHSPLKKELIQHLKKIEKESEFPSYQQILSATIGKTVAYAEKEEFLTMLCSLAKKKSLLKTITSLPSQQVVSELEKSPALSMIQRHMEKYAWITAEYKSKPWSLERWIDQVKKYISSAELNLKKQRQEFDTALQEKILLQNSIPFSDEALRVLDFLDACNIQRDWAKGKFSEGFLYFRSLAEEIAHRFGLGFEDIYLLSSEELVYALDTGIIDRNLIIQRREKGFALRVVQGNESLHEADEVANLMSAEGIGDFFSKIPDTDVAKGLPACTGKVRGIARIIDKAEDINNFKDEEILVTYMTTMEFTPLFSRAKAIVCDEGGVSSHAAIVSREFDIPCVVGAKNAMRIFKTGDLIEVDAHKGVVRLLKK